MTVLVGVKCTDGVVIGADSIATSSYGPARLMQVQTDKLSLIGDRVIVAGSGAVGLNQRFVHIVQQGWDGGIFGADCLGCSRNLSRAVLQDFQQTGVPFSPEQGWNYVALLAAPLEDQAELIEFGPMDLQPERKGGRLHFVAMGSGQMLAEPFMAFISRVIWGGEPPDVQTAMFGVYWALRHACLIAPGGVGEPIKLSTLRKGENGDWIARLLGEDELQEQAQHIAAIEERISDYPSCILQNAAVEPPPVPPAATDDKAAGKLADPQGRKSVIDAAER